MDMFRTINAAIKTDFKHRDGFKAAHTSYVGSIPAVRFAGDMPVSLVCDIAHWIETNYAQFVRPTGRWSAVRHISYIDGGVVINWT